MDKVLSIMHALFVKKIQATYNKNMEEKHYTLGTNIFLNLITLTADWKKLLMEGKSMK